MKLHIFNPEHDIALAADKAYLTLPHTIQEFKVNLGFLPALWADDGDLVLVDDVFYAIKALSQVNKRHADVLFVTANDLKSLVLSAVEPWGWDRAIRQLLADAGVNLDVLPTDEVLDNIRNLSNRRQTNALLPILRNEFEDVTCGESLFCGSVEEVYETLFKYGKIVVKAPWSSSGRGVRYVERDSIKSADGWIKNVVARQDGVSVEPYYRKVKDFALEFYSHGNGTVDYCGISLFRTGGCNYAGNIIASEVEKSHIISNYLPLSLIDVIVERLKTYFSSGDFGRYKGHLGVDMMIVAGNEGRGYLLHPCVEVNVRRTMGHVANSFKPDITAPSLLMHIVHGVNFRLKFDNLENNFVKVL